jgi:hypothetical protein
MTVMTMILTPHAFVLMALVANAPCIAWSEYSIGNVKKPNHPFPPSAAAAAGDSATALAAASAVVNAVSSMADSRKKW